MALIQGTPGADTLIGTDEDDEIRPRDGADLIRGGAGHDRINGSLSADGRRTWFIVTGSKTVFGGAGDDVIFGGDLADQLTGDDGHDLLDGLAGDDVLEGAEGSDSLFGGAGRDTLDGGAGNDFLNGESGDDSMIGGDGHDQLFHQGSGAATLLGGAGEDVLNAFTGIGPKHLDGGSGADTLTGSVAGDLLLGGDGDDRLSGVEGADTLDGGAGADTLFGAEAGDVLIGGEGSDVLVHQTAGAATLMGGAGDDLLNAFTASDPKFLSGGDGADSLFGGLNADRLMGDAGHDRIQGDEGADTLSGGAGQDTLFGGAGDDTYILDDRMDRVVDSGGVDTAVIQADGIKVPASIENRVYGEGVQALPYWIDALVDSQAHWYATLVPADRTLGFTFPDRLPAYSTAADDAQGFAAFSPAQIEQTRLALALFSRHLNLQFAPTTEAQAVGTLAFALNRQNNSAGYARYPSDTPSGSDVFLNNSPSNATLADGTYGALTLVHEIAHALGLKHPFSAADSMGEVEEGPYLSGREDHTTWTVMSYNDNPEHYRLALRELDIAALQFIYGPNPAGRADDTRHLVVAQAPNFIWDGAGEDTLDASGLGTGATLYLEPGRWGFVGTARSTLITDPGQVTVNFGSVLEHLVGSPHADELHGNTGHNRLMGAGGADTLIGGRGSDTLEGGEGNDRLDGGEGLDWARYDRAAADYSIVRDAIGASVGISAQAGIAGQGQDTLVNIERLRFADKVLALDIDGHAGQAFRLYQAAFDRQPDLGGLGFYIWGLDTAVVNLESAAATFFNSAEFKALYGENVSNDRFVDLLYRHVHHRAPDAGGLDFWIGALVNRDGAYGRNYSRAEVLVAFSESPENKANVVGLIANGIEYSPFTG